MKRSIVNQGFVVALILAHLLLISCEKNPTEPGEGEQPALPPPASMSLDLSLFTNSTALAKSVTQANPPGLNFITARTTVAIINFGVIVVMAVPTATFAAAASQTPEFKSDGKFHWIYTVEHNGQQYQADLAGWIDTPAKESVWEMRITAPGLNNFLWYEGRASLQEKTGYWEVYDAQQPGSSVKVLRIDWQVPSDTEATLTFKVVKPNVSENGDTLTYHSSGSSCSVVFFDKSEDATIDIALDANTHAGSITAPNYNNGNKACWDEQLQDTNCP